MVFGVMLGFPVSFSGYVLYFRFAIRVMIGLCLLFGFGACFRDWLCIFSVWLFGFVSYFDISGFMLVFCRFGFRFVILGNLSSCLLYTSDAADDA